jgi:serine/threonine protein kinase
MIVTRGTSVIGQTIAQYRVLAKLGQGGMGEVFLATDTQLGRQVALKFLPPKLQRDEKARRRFLREAKSAAALDHPFICHAHEVGNHEGRDFIAMEYVEGETLSTCLKRGPLPVTDALRLVQEIAEALNEAHAAEIVHRDLKPENIIITPSGHAKVMDFGLAKRLRSEASKPHRSTEIKVTQKGEMVGTVPYMSPEQVLGQAVGFQSDVFSFGTVIYELLTGVHPFRKGNWFQTGRAILLDTPPTLAERVPDVPVALARTVEQMLDKDPEKRFASGAEVLKALREAASV